MAEPSASESSAATDSDQDFDPSAEMLINDFDDEHTLDEEEAMDDDNNGSEEIDELNKEGEMPLEELLAMYGYNQGSSCKSEKGDVTSSTTALAATTGDSNSSSGSNSLDQSVPNTSHFNTPSSTTRPQHVDQLSSQTNWSSVAACSSLITSVNDVSESEEDISENEDDSWRRTIQVGSDYQASIPDGLCKYGDLPAYENEDKILWDPDSMSDKAIENYLRQIQEIDALESAEKIKVGNNGSDDGTPFVAIPDTTLPYGCHIRDNEQALFLLLQCGHKVEEALRRRRIQPQTNTIYEPMSSWSEDECRNFEEGLKTYGKDFHLIQKNKVRTRSVSELVQFYYLWKKTARHDLFASKWRIEKKKYSLHPGTTDYMDRFLDEQENLALQTHSLSSSSYNLQPTTRQQFHASYSLMPPSSYHLASSQNLLGGSSSRPDSVMESLAVLANTVCDSGGGESAASASSASHNFVNGLAKNESNVQCSSSSSVTNAVSKFCSPSSSDSCLPSATNGPDSSVRSIAESNNVTSSNNPDY